MKPVLGHVPKHVIRPMLERMLGYMPGHAPSKVLKHMPARYAPQ